MRLYAFILILDSVSISCVGVDMAGEDVCGGVQCSGVQQWCPPLPGDLECF